MSNNIKKNETPSDADKSALSVAEVAAVARGFAAPEIDPSFLDSNSDLLEIQKNNPPIPEKNNTPAPAPAPIPIPVSVPLETPIVVKAEPKPEPAKEKSAPVLRKYILTSETKEAEGRIVHRIMAVRDFGDVKKGYLGGWVESERNLSHSGYCWLYGDSEARERAVVSENAMLYDSAYAYGDSRVYGNAKMYDFTEIYGKGRMYDNAKISGYSKVHGNAKIFDNGYLSGNSELKEDAIIHDDATVQGTSIIAGKMDICGDSRIERITYGKEVIQSVNDFPSRE